MHIKRTKEDIKSTGADNLKDFYFNTLFKEMEGLSVTDDERRRENRIEAEEELYPVGFRPYNDVWRYEPVSTRYFFTHFIKETPTDKQQEFLDVVCGVDPFDFTDEKYEEADLMWGKGSGKDTTVAKAFTYQGYKLACLANPQKYLGLGVGSPIDLVCVASNAEQARNIFFKYLKAFIKETRDPETGYSWFATKNFWWDSGKRDFEYMDLREKDGDIKQKEIDFGRSITCHSLTSDRFTGEGKTIVLAVMDEVGAMSPVNVFGSKNGGNDNKMVGQYRSLGTSVRRSSKYGKMVCISYKYGRNCPMTIMVRKNKNDPKKFVRVYSVYEVRTDKDEKQLRKQFESDYRDDPEVAKMIYECKNPEIETDLFFSNVFVLNGSTDATKKFSINPCKGGIYTCSDLSEGVGIFEDWFRGHPDFYYAVHGDLAKGQVWKGGDAAGIAMGHLQEIRVSYDKAWIDYYKKKYEVDLSQYQGELRVGVVMDLLLQITCTPDQRELRISDFRRLIEELQEKRGFSIIRATFDRWGSEETIQELNRKGIESSLLSMDSNYRPWHTEKGMMQQGIFKAYYNPIWLRENRELMDTGKKIDHPEISVSRLEEEGYEHGSKDLADCSAGVTDTLMRELYNDGEIVFG